jgi:hypothetical protein
MDCVVAVDLGISVDDVGVSVAVVAVVAVVVNDVVNDVVAVLRA